MQLIFCTLRTSPISFLQVFFGPMVATNSYSNLILHAIGTAEVQSFDTFASGTVLTTIGNLSFSDSSGAPLIITSDHGRTLNNGPAFGIDSTANVVRSDNSPAFPPITNFTQTSTLTFSLASPRSAFGLFVLFDNFNPLNTGTISLLSNASPTTATASGTTSPTEFSGIANDIFFVGLYDDTGGSTISSLTLSVSGGTMRYSFDHVVTVDPVSVPEPGSLLAITILASCGKSVGGISQSIKLLHRRRRKGQH